MSSCQHERMKAKRTCSVDAAFEEEDVVIEFVRNEICKMASFILRSATPYAVTSASEKTSAAYLTIPARASMSLTNSRRTSGLSKAIRRCFTSGGMGSSSHQRLATQAQSSS